MAGGGAEMEAAVTLGGEVTAEATFSVEADAPTAVRTLAYPVP
jgi:hypothetical protein